MKRKTFAVVLSLCMAVTMLLPAQALGKDEEPAAQEPAAAATEVDESVTQEPEAAEPAAEEQQEAEPAEDFTKEETPEEPEAGNVEEPYMAQSLVEFYDAGKLLLPEEISSDNVTKPKNSNGLLFSGTKSALTAGKIRIADHFTFTEGTVGRITIDGLGDRGSKTAVEIYLDDQEAPVATVSLRNQMGKTGWGLVGDRTTDVLGKDITGPHDVSLRIVDKGGKGDTDSMSVLLRSVEFAENSLPVMWFNIDETQGSVSAMNGDVDHNTECYGEVYLEIPNGYQCEYTDKDLKSETLQLDYIRGRGNSTWYADKKPYKVALKDKKDLFGMGKNRHWVLLANRYDNSFMRNKMTYWLGDKLGLEFTPESVPVEVVMNGEFYGTYYLTEQIRVGKARVNIDDLEDSPDATTEPEITGGYLISMEPYDDEPNGDNAFSTEHNVNFFLENPSFEDYTNEAQMNYIKVYMQQVENAIFGKDFKDAAGHSYSEYMDVDSAIDYFWVQELSMNGDAYGSGSTYLYKKRNGKLYWGPLWDFDYVAWGDLEYNEYYTDDLNYTSTPWFNRLRNDPEFIQKAVERWPVIKGYMDEITQEGGLLDQYYSQLATSRRYDEEKYGVYVEEDWFADSSQINPDDYNRTYREQVEQLRGWIDQRVEWVDANLDQLKPYKCKVKFKAGKKVIKTKTVLSDEKIGALPKAPAKKGYYFVGWYDGNDRLTKDWRVYYSTTVKAKYLKKSKAARAKKIYLNEYSTICVLREYEYPLSYTIRPLNAYNRNVKWSSSDPEIATVDTAGKVSFCGVGTVTITASIKNGPSAKCKIKVVKNYDEVEYGWGYRINREKLKLKRGGSSQLKVITSPKMCCKPYDTIWISTNSKVASVNQMGVVTARKKGKATIYAFDMGSEDIYKCKVRVTE